MVAFTDSQQNTVDERMKEGYLLVFFFGGAIENHANFFEGDEAVPPTPLFFVSIDSKQV
jgi:hypothetical protein